jgi:hypothetical protein
MIAQPLFEPYAPTNFVTTRAGTFSALETEKPLCGAFFNGASRTRTGDLLGAIQALSQLSYSPAVGPV